jgi:hypothetical protein
VPQKDDPKNLFPKGVGRRNFQLLVEIFKKHSNPKKLTKFIIVIYCRLFQNRAMEKKDFEKG